MLCKTSNASLDKRMYMYIARLLTSGLILDYNNRGSNPRLRPGYDLFWVADPWITNNLGSQKYIYIYI